MENQIVPLELLIKYPTFKCVKQGDSFFYHGMIIVNADRYELKVKVTPSNEATKFELIDGSSALNKFKEHIQMLNDEPGINDITIYVNKLESIIKKYSPFPKNNCFVYRKILSEYTEFTKFYIDLKSCSLSPDLSSIKASSCDEKGREHSVEIGIDFKETVDLFYLKDFDLPKSRNDTSDKKSSSLVELYNLFLGYLEGLQQYFDLMDSIDKNSTVIDPKIQMYKNNFRRISLGANVSVVITIDPFNINSCPLLSFVGPERLVDSFRNHINDNIQNWDHGGEVLSEILKLLGLSEFPLGPDNSFGTNQSVLLKEDCDCSICFCSNLDGNLPDIICNNKCCENYYHKSCLYEWLLSINSKKIFNNIQGPCPNCEKMISCPIPD